MPSELDVSDGFVKPDELHHSIAALSIIALKREPEALQSEVEKLDHDLGDLAHANRAVFIESFRSIDESKAQFDTFNENLGQICDDLPRLEVSCARFERAATDIAARHKSNQQTLRQHTQLLELLEIPQLMDTCVRNGLFSEALDLAAHVNVLERRHVTPSTSSTSASSDGATMIVASIVQEVRRLALQMREQLLRRLSGDIPLPMCLTLVSHLQRLYSLVGSTAAISAASASASASSAAAAAAAAVAASAIAPKWDIELEFLQCRETRLLGVLEELPRDNAYQFLMRLVEQSRVHWFDILTQFKAIFFVAEEDGIDDDDGVSFGGSGRLSGRLSSRRGGGGEHDDGSDSALPPSRADGLRQRLLLSNWVVGKIGSLLNTLSKCLPMLSNGQQLAGVFEQSNYFGLSLARVGADFRAYLPPLFEARLVEMMDESWSTAHERFELWMLGSGSAMESTTTSMERAVSLSNSQWFHSFDRDAVGGESSAASASASLDAIDGGAREGDDPLTVAWKTPLSLSGAGAGAGAALAPPPALLAVPLLAELTNMYLASLNELRLCARSMPGCEVQLAAALRGALCALVPVLAEVFAHFSAVAEDEPEAGEGEELNGARLCLAKLDVVCKLTALQMVPYVVTAFGSTFSAVREDAAQATIAAFKSEMVKQGFGAVYV